MSDKFKKMTSKSKRSQDLYRSAGLKPVQVWIYSDDTAAESRLKSEDKRAEVKAARDRGK